MANATYQISVDGEPVATMTADFSQASSPLLMDGDSTPFQVADARHRIEVAALMLLTNAWSTGCAVCEVDDDGNVVGDVTVEEINDQWVVEVKSIGGWTLHSTHPSYRDAVDQADMVHGRVLCPTGLPDREAWQYAHFNGSFDGAYPDWTAMDDEEREEYETGASGIGTA